MKTSPSQIAVLGAGSWGTAVALSLAHQGHQVLLWARDVSYLKHQENERYLPKIPFPNNLRVTDKLEEALAKPFILIAVPSNAMQCLLQSIPKLPKSGIAWLTKGLEPKTHQLFSTLIQKQFGQNTPMALISGPSFAKEVALQKPTGLVVAGNHESIRKTWQKLLHSEYNRVYTSDDLIGVELCGAIKNVIAIACGISDGLSFGANARAALITRGLAEMTRLGLALGAKEESFTSLAGMGDLVLTCTDNQSRNRRFGLYLGQGKTIEEAKKEVFQVVEGLHNATQVMHLAKTHHIDMPICEAVEAVITNKCTPAQAAKRLVRRPLKH